MTRFLETCGSQKPTHQRALEVDEQEMLSYQCQSRTGGAAMDLRLELVSVPVADVDRAKAFYVDQVGYGVEQDVQVDENHRFVELMPPGSPCSIALTTGYIDSEPGCLKGVQLNVENVDEVHAFLRDRDVEVSEIQDYPWGRFCFFSDPDGNGWSIHGPLHPE
jgi:catechol 2,3-dioxygenase-like lactoylglutathione lyase family enzyme